MKIQPSIAVPDPTLVSDPHFAEHFQGVSLEKKIHEEFGEEITLSTSNVPPFEAQQESTPSATQSQRTQSIDAENEPMPSAVEGNINSLIETLSKPTPIEAGNELMSDAVEGNANALIEAQDKPTPPAAGNEAMPSAVERDINASIESLNKPTPIEAEIQRMSSAKGYTDSLTVAQDNQTSVEGENEPFTSVDERVTNALIEDQDKPTPMENENEPMPSAVERDTNVVNEAQDKLSPPDTENEPICSSIGENDTLNMPRGERKSSLVEQEHVSSVMHGVCPPASRSTPGLTLRLFGQPSTLPQGNPYSNGIDHEPSSDFVKPTVWKWVEDTRVVSGIVKGRRTHYRGVQAIRGNRTRCFWVGDTVCMQGERNEHWVAQIVDMFQTDRDDPELSPWLPPQALPGNSNATDLMRCTLRWFYNPSNINQRSYWETGLPPMQFNEVFFSDFLEISGFNSVGVIEGKAWLFENEHTMRNFLKKPAPEYDGRTDVARVVKCFVNNNSKKLNVRKLKSGELFYLLRNPSAETNLYNEAPKRFFH